MFGVPKKENVMRMVKKEVINDKSVITTESKFLWWKNEQKFVAQREFPKGYWTWLELPNLTLVPDSLSFQLDEWNRI